MMFSILRHGAPVKTSGEWCYVNGCMPPVTERMRGRERKSEIESVIQQAAADFCRLDCLREI